MPEVSRVRTEMGRVKWGARAPCMSTDWVGEVADGDRDSISGFFTCLRAMMFMLHGALSDMDGALVGFGQKVFNYPSNAMEGYTALGQTRTPLGLPAQPASRAP